MMNFLPNHLELVLALIFAGIFIALLVRLLGKAKRIELEGQETDAVVSRIEDVSDPGSAPSYITYVSYRDENGENRESPMSISPTADYEVGQRIRIKFLSGKYDMVRFSRNI